MIEIHLFNLNNQLATERAQICVFETLQHQTNYHLNIWTEKTPEIAEIIQNSKYCQAVLKTEPMYWPSIYDYVKMHIMKRYGGWFFELDQIVKTDLSTVEVDENCSYFSLHGEFPNTFVTTWMPIYASKGVYVDELIRNADELYSDPLDLSEGTICKYDLDKVPENVFPFKPVEYYHFDTGSYCHPRPYGYSRLLFEENGALKTYYYDFGDTKISFVAPSYNFETFNKIGRLFNYFDVEVPKLLDAGGKYCLSQSVYDKAAKEYNLDSRITIIPDSECCGDLSRFF